MTSKVDNELDLKRIQDWTDLLNLLNNNGIPYTFNKDTECIEIYRPDVTGYSYYR